MSPSQIDAMFVEMPEIQEVPLNFTPLSGEGRLVVPEVKRLKTVTLRIDPEIHEKFKTLAKNRGQAMSKILYRAILAFVQAHRDNVLNN